MLGPDEAQLGLLEKVHAKGITSAGLLDVFSSLELPLSEATLRKYVQLGLLPRSVRVGRKGKHQGSQGLYPVSVIRRILSIKALMAESFTIEQIQKDFFFVRNDIEQLERTLAAVFASLNRVLAERRLTRWLPEVSRDVEGARGMAKDLLGRLLAIEERLAHPASTEADPETRISSAS